MSLSCGSSLCRRFPNSVEFPKRIVRLNLSEGIRDMGIRFPISSSVISGWTNQSSLHTLSFSFSPSISLFRHPNHPPKMHYRISQWLRSFDAWMLEARRAIVVRRGKATRGRGCRKVRAIVTSTRCYLTQLRYFIPVSLFLSRLLNCLYPDELL